MNQTNATFLHLRRPLVTIRPDRMEGSDKGPKGGITIAYRLSIPEGLSLGIARCNPTDHYNKATGRNIALAQLNEAPITVPFTAPSKEEVIEAIIDFVGNRHDLVKSLTPAIRVFGASK